MRTINLIIATLAIFVMPSSPGPICMKAEGRESLRAEEAESLRAEGAENIGAERRDSLLTEEGESLRAEEAEGFRIEEAGSRRADDGVRMGERVAVKTNLLYDALLNVNIGVEVAVGRRWSVDLSGNYNNWSLSHGRQWKHWMLQPEVRYRLRNDGMSGHFLAAHLFGGQFNTTLRDYRRQGWGAGIGAGYGYTWRWGRHWGAEAEIAVGYARYSYDKYPCTGCGRKIATRSRNYVGPTKAAVTLAYYFGGAKGEAIAVAEPVEQIAMPVETAAIDTIPYFSFPIVDVPHSRVLTANLSGVARIGFMTNSTEIDPEFADNRDELASITGKLDSICSDLGMDIHRIQLTGYASPEGGRLNNDRLAYGRTQAVKRYLQQQAGLPDSVIHISHVAEDWDGLRKWVQSSGLPDREELLAIIDTPRDPDAKEALLKKHKESWERIKREALPGLRRTEYRIDYRHQYEETEVQTLQDVNRHILSREPDEAARLLVDIPSSPEADYARGAVAAMQGRYEEARAWFERALSRGVGEAREALRQLQPYINEKTTE